MFKPFLLLYVLLGLAASVAGQSFQGGLRGTVRDAQGVVPGVAVTLVNQESGVSRETATNEAGEYSFPGVVPGVYSVRASVAGFKTFERRDVRIGTQQFLMLDIALEVGAVEETITVTADAPLIETSNASTGDVLSNETLQALPSISRMAYLVSNTLPTVTYTGNPNMNRMQDQTEAAKISLGGGPSIGNNYLLDGFPITDLQNRSSANPSIEMLQDLKVQIHTYDAEMGRTGGGVFNASARSGSNVFRGSGFGLLRPGGLIGQNFFLKLQGRPNPDQFWRNVGGGFGGPIIRGKTFFWIAAEGYRDGLTQNGNLHVPTLAMRNGDFSRVTDTSGRPILIYDPLTTDPVTGARQPFPGNIVPRERFNIVGVNILTDYPLPNVNPEFDNGRPNYITEDTPNNLGQQVSLKLDHQFTRNVGLTGLYLHQYTEEPRLGFFHDAPYMQGGQNNRPIHVAVLNNTYIMNASTVMTLRAGLNTFDDITPLEDPFDAHTLGFNPRFADAIPVQRFPALTLTGYDGTSYTGQGRTHYYSHGFNGTITKLVDAHSIKFGADYRLLGVKARTYGNSAGAFTFNGQFTGSNATSPAATSRNAIADLLLGFPSAGSIPLNTETNNFIRYYSAYVQDDYRVSDRLSVDYGIRFEHETGLAERNNQLVVGFDRDAISPLNVTIPAGLDPLHPEARPVKGGLVYAGVNGAKTHLGDPENVKVSPRAGAVYRLGDMTVLRGGYGLFWAPTSSGPVNSVGYSQTTNLVQNTAIPITSIDDPFPSGFIQPTGNTLGLASGVGSAISFVDPDRKAPRIHKYSFDLQRELPGDMSVSVGYVGSSANHLPLGTNVNINQLPAEYLSLGSRLTSLVANPFFGVADAGPLAGQRTVQLNSLLVPYPQYGLNSVSMTTGDGRSQYHAFVVQLRKRVTNRWGGNFSYTLSDLRDNVVGQGNYFSSAPGIMDNYNYIPWSPTYAPDVDYGLSLLDMRHKLVLSPIVQLPFGEGQPYLNRSGWLDYLVGGWRLAAVVLLQSGFPLGVSQTPNTTNLNGAGQRPNLTGSEALVPGDITDRLQNNPSDNLYLNPAAFSLAPAFTFGNVPRILPGIRSVGRSSTDLALDKQIRTGGSTRVSVRLEVINLFNTPWYTSLASTSVGAANFGQVTTQANLSRFSQVTVRFDW
jgi:trimeric autotransporter adhesin